MKYQWPSTAFLLSCLVFCHLVHAVPDLRVVELLGELSTALRRARANMRDRDRSLPIFDTAYASGGACYRGFGTSIRYQDCSAALGLMPAIYGPSEVKLSTAGLLVDTVYELHHPLIWKHGDCVIGISLFDELAARGLRRPFRDAAGTIVDECVTRAIGGMVRFAHFEVVVFQETLLPRGLGEPVIAFAHNTLNLPFSTGVERLWLGISP